VFSDGPDRQNFFITFSANKISRLFNEFWVVEKMRVNTKHRSVVIDLNDFKLYIYLKKRIELTLYFNTPFRRFCLSVIGLVVNAMKRQGNPPWNVNITSMFWWMIRLGLYWINEKGKFAAENLQKMEGCSTYPERTSAFWGPRQEKGIWWMRGLRESDYRYNTVAATR